MTFTSLASSSHGNCYVVSDGQTAILLECGISFRRIKKGLGFDLSSIRAPRALWTSSNPVWRFSQARGLPMPWAAT